MSKNTNHWLNEYCFKRTRTEIDHNLIVVNYNFTKIKWHSQFKSLCYTIIIEKYLWDRIKIKTNLSSIINNQSIEVVKRWGIKTVSGIN
jgi:hypothetical protein